MNHRTVALASSLLAFGCSGNSGNDAEARYGFEDGGSRVVTGAPVDGSPPDCLGRPGASGDHVLTLTSSGVTRTSRLHVPPSYDPEAATALVLAFHGFSRDGAQQEAMTGMDSVVDVRGFIAAYPDGLGNAWNGGTCCTTTSDDVQFARDLVAEISKAFCIDEKRVFATGISNGGLMTNRLACEAADLFAAVAPIASGIGVSCAPSRPVPHLAFGGTADPLVPFALTQAEAEQWRALNGCSDASSEVYRQGDAACVEWAQCLEGAAVRLCTIDGGGHTWPGSAEPLPWGKTSTDISATSAMLEFFERHTMP
jgi:polyhydroxybutyrate depolymerase